MCFTLHVALPESTFCNAFDATYRKSRDGVCIIYSDENFSLNIKQSNVNVQNLRDRRAPIKMKKGKICSTLKAMRLRES